jgi:hypothetical protein
MLCAGLTRVDMAKGADVAKKRKSFISRKTLVFYKRTW